jgi:hypothetical protein
VPDTWKLHSGAIGQRDRGGFPQSFMAPLTDDQLDRLRRCAEGNTLRFESSTIVAALVAGGYAREGAGRVVTVTLKGYRYLKMYASRR